MANIYYVLEIQTNYYEIEEPTTLIIEAYDFSVPSGIPASILTEKGSMIVATGIGAASETGGPSANDQVWVSDDTEPLGGRWGAQSGGGGDVDLTNQSGTDQVAGTVVIHDADNNNSFKLTTTLRDRRVIGVLSEDIANGATGKVAIVGKIVTVRVQGNVSRGQWLIASATTGRAQQDGYTRPPGALGMALTAYSGGSTGTVEALISVDLYLGASKGKGYVMGGSTGANIASAQVLSFVSETTSIIAGAALTTARQSGGSGSGPLHGYIVGGYVAANSAVVDKCVFSTDVTSVMAAMPAARRDQTRNVGGSLACYVMGGYVAAYSALCDKTPFSTDVTAALAGGNLTVARGDEPASYSSTTNGYIAGGYAATYSVICDKMPFSSEITAALASGNLVTARSGVAGVHSTTDGYNLGGYTGANSALAGKMPFSTDTNAAVASANLSLARYFTSGLSGVLAGWIMGGNSGAVSAVADKLTYSTDTTAAAAGANLPTASSGHASLSTTNY